MTSTDARHHADRLADLLRQEHDALVEFLVALADFDRSRGWADLGHPSLWAFLHRDLGLSATAAFQRKVAAELLQRHPGVEAPLRDGRLCMSSMAQLARVLDDGNVAEVLPRFFRLSAREAKEVVAELRPSADGPRRDLVTALAVPRPAYAFPTSDTGAASPGAGGPGGLAATDVPTDSAAPQAKSAPSAEAPPVEAVGLPADDHSAGPTGATDRLVQGSPFPTSETPPPLPADSIEPLDAELRRLHLTVSRRFLKKLESLRLARSHARPDATTADLLEEAVDRMLASEGKRRTGATSRPRSRPRPASPDQVPAHVRRYVWERDGGCCRWPIEGGGVCGSKLRLEIDHIVPRARGGPATPGNLRLLCGFHNAEAARRTFGEAWMAQFRRKAAP